MRYTRVSLYSFRPFCQHPIRPGVGFFSPQCIHLVIGFFAPSDMISRRLHRQRISDFL